MPLESNRETLLFVQLESPAALEETEAIAAVEGVDGIFLGPGDLALRLGCGPGATDPVMSEVQTRVAAAAAGNNKFWGRPVQTEAEIDTVVKAGARFVVYGAEYRMMRAGLEHHGKTLERLLG